MRVIYHSHVDVGDYFSAEDKRAALFEGEPLYPVAYLVIDAMKNGVMGARLYTWHADQRDFVQVEHYDTRGHPL